MALTKTSDCSPMNTHAPSSHGHAARGTSRKGPWKKGTNAKLKSATHPSITGRNRPSPHAGDHFCTSTSKIANIVAEQAE